MQCIIKSKVLFWLARVSINLLLTIRPNTGDDTMEAYYDDIHAAKIEELILARMKGK
jgi:hypothetical protein